MEEVGRCQLYFPRRFIGVSPWLDHYTNPLVSCIRAREKWNGEGWTAIYTQFLGLREVTYALCHWLAYRHPGDWPRSTFMGLKQNLEHPMSCELDGLREILIPEEKSHFSQNHA